MDYIQGLDRKQATMFPTIMDDYIAEDNPVRFIDAYVDSLNFVELGFRYAEPAATGRKPYNPADLTKLYLYGYINQPRSSRRLEKEAHKNIELMWLLRGLKPDFKTIADFRKDNGKAIRKVCREFIFYCRELELFSLELVGIDGSKFTAVNHTQKSYTKTTLQKLITDIDKSIDGYLQELEKNDKNEKEVNKPTANELKDKINQLKSQKEKYNHYKKKLDETGESQISLTDPDSRIMRTGHNGRDVCYNTQFAVDSKNSIIVNYDVTNDKNDYHQLDKITSSIKEQFQLDELEIVADLGYFEKNEIKKCHDNKVKCYIPEDRKSKNHKLGLYTNKDFKYNSNDDYYICPAGQKLIWTKYRKRNNKRDKVYWTQACRLCKKKSKCTTAQDIRCLYRWEHEDIIDQMNKRVKENPEIIKKRKEIVEHPFGTIKHSMGHSYFLCRGLDMVKTEMSLSVLAYNIKRAINIFGVKELKIALAKKITEKNIKIYSSTFLPFLNYHLKKYRFYLFQF